MPTRRILLADDEGINLAILKEIFKVEGFEVACAADGAEAMGLLEGGAFDLVVTDLNMPRGGGLEVARVARRQRPQRPVVVMSSIWAPEPLRAARAVADDVLSKPFDGRAVATMVRRLLDGKQGK